MSITPGGTILASDFLNMMSGTTIATLASGSTAATIVAAASNRLTVWAKGTVAIPSGTPGTVVTNMKYGSTIIDTVTLSGANSGGYGTSGEAVFVYSSKPGSGSFAIKFDQPMTNVTVVTMLLDSN